MLINDIADCNITMYKDGTAVITRQMRYYERTAPIKKAEKRVYRIKRIQVRSSLIDLWLRRRSKYLLFFTVTLPFAMDEQTAAACWQGFLKNMRLHYKLNQYVWVKEFQKNGNIHYHIIIDRNRVGIQYLQKTWNNVIANITGTFPMYNNSVRLGNNPIIRNIHSVASYLSKYISKEKNEFSGRAWGRSDGLILKRSIDIDEFDYLAEKYGIIQIVNTNFYNIYIIKNYFDTG